jgi:beta-N-acetylhexosaminidase
MVDSHHDLPVVDTDYQTLCRTDFVPFCTLRGEAYAMTAHVVYTAIDPVNPITLSKTGIAKVIRGEIGFGGKIMSDDLGMKALKGDWRALSHQSLAAGCDIILHCSGVLAEMQEIATAVREYREQHGI